MSMGGGGEEGTGRGTGRGDCRRVEGKWFQATSRGQYRILGGWSMSMGGGGEEGTGRGTGRGDCRRVEYVDAGRLRTRGAHRQPTTLEYGMIVVRGMRGIAGNSADARTDVG